MDPRRSARAVVFFLIGVVVLWGALAWILPYVDSLKGSGEPQVRQEVSRSGEVATPVLVRHSVDGNRHTYAGTLDLPTPCHNLMAKVTTSGGRSSAVKIELTITADPLAICVQVITPTVFEVSVTTTSAEPAVTLFLDDKETPVSLVEAGG